MTTRRRFLVAALTLLLAAAGLARGWRDLVERRVAVVVPGRILRGAWQGPGPLLRLLRREHVRTVVTLTAINRDDPKYIAQDAAIRRAGVGWRIVPMRGSTATLDQLAEAADLLADPGRQPVFFHCVGGHHRTNLVHAAYRVRHEGWSADRAWREVAALPWTRPEADDDDRLLIRAFADRYGTRREPPRDEPTTDPLGPPRVAGDGPHAGRVRRPAVGHG